MGSFPRSLNWSLHLKEVADGDVNKNNKRSRGLSQEDDEEDDEDDDVPGNKQFSVNVLLSFSFNDYGT